MCTALTIYQKEDVEFFDREDALAVLGIAFCQSVLFRLSVGILTKVFFLLSGDVLTTEIFLSGGVAKLLS